MKTVGRQKRIWVYNIKMELKEMALVGLHRTRSSSGWDTWRAVVNTVMNSFAPYSAHLKGNELRVE
jgi:hypothetical protein